MVISFGVVLTAASEFAFAFSGRAARTHDVPEFMHVLLSTLVCAPVVFVARLRWLDRWKPLRAHDAGLLGLLALVLALPAVGLSSLWREAFRRWDAPAWLAFMFFLAVVSMGLWRAFVVRHFARRDLPA